MHVRLLGGRECSRHCVKPGRAEEFQLLMEWFVLERTLHILSTPPVLSRDISEIRSSWQREPSVGFSWVFYVKRNANNSEHNLCPWPMHGCPSLKARVSVGTAGNQKFTIWFSGHGGI